MKILPTLNIQNARVVPVFRAGGEACEPMEVLADLLARGFTRLVLVDVDAARGQGSNRDLLVQMMHRFHRAVPRPCIQVGGGIRSSDQAQFFLDQGASWLMVGTLLQRSPLLVDQLLARFSDHLIAGIDARAGEIQHSGWMEPVRLEAVTAGARIRNHGFRRLLFMDIPVGEAPEPDFGTAQILATTSRAATFMGGSILTPAHLKAAMDLPSLQGVALDALLLRETPELVQGLVPVQG